MHRILHIILTLALLGASCTWFTAPKAHPTLDDTAREHSRTAAKPDTSKSVAPRDTTKAMDTAARADSAAIASITPASELLIRACDNYLTINPKSAKVVEVLGLKAATFYNNKVFGKARESYERILTDFPDNPEAMESMRMVAQSFYEEKEFDKAQEWYRKLRDKAPEGGDKSEATARIAESIYRIAEALEAQQRYKDAAEQYERVALEFPEARIADVSLFNAGSAYEKLALWSQAILQYQRLTQKYATSDLVPKGLFRTAKCNEKLSNWDVAGQTYLRVIAGYPHSDLAPSALYNAGFCYENADKLIEAAAAFEKLVELFPNNEDAADVLFKAGELYGKLKDWQNVTRVNTEFAQRFGNDTNRVVQAQCMIGIALFMQNKETDAISQLEKTLAVFGRIRSPSTVNRYYAAKAQYTLGEIYQGNMNKIELVQPEAVYKRNLRDKSDLLDKSIAAFSGVVKYAISEWTTRSIFQVGQSYEDFARALFKQERPKGLSIDRQLALELGIAKAVEDYLINKAMHFHEQNVKLGIKEKIEDKYVLESRTKLIFLPFSVGKNYLMLVDIAKASDQGSTATGFALIAKELETLQKIAPFQERAIELFLSCLEKATTYQELNDYYKQASSLITSISFTVGETYSDVSIIAREAPVPETFDDYEKFVYKTKLLQQIQSYEDQALKNYLRTVKIAEAYSIQDDYVVRARDRIPQVLFLRGRCYDLLGTQVFSTPPFPANIDEAQKEEFKARFEEVGMKFQDQANEIYRSVMDYADKKYASGDFVTFAYVRLFQQKPKEYGTKQESMKPTTITSGPQWKVTADTSSCWNQVECDDNGWSKVHKGKMTTVGLTGFPAELPTPMWYGKGSPKDTANYAPYDSLNFRYTFYKREKLNQADLYASGVDQYQIYVNGSLLPQDTSTQALAATVRKWDIAPLIRDGKNVLAARVENIGRRNFGFMPYVKMMTTVEEFVPKPPGFDHPLAAVDVAESTYVFPFIKNFSPETATAEGK